MKKLIFVSLLCLVFVALSGCSPLTDRLLGSQTGTSSTGQTASLPSSDPTGSSKGEFSAPIPTPVTELSPEELLSTLQFHLDLINQCYAETCGAVLGSTEYSRIYTSAEAMMAGEGPISIVERSTLNGSNLTDPTASVLYEIQNFRTNAEALSYLEQYMTPEIAKKLFCEFFEVDGKLYMVYGSRGYGAIQLDLDTASISISGDTCAVTLDQCLFDEKISTCTVSFKKQGESWIITDIETDSQ